MKSFVWPVAALALSACASGGVDPGYKIDSKAPKLSDKEIKVILSQAETAAKATPSFIRVDKEGKKAMCKMHVIVVNRKGEEVGRLSMPDAWVGSVSIAASKAFTSAAFSSNENAVTSRSLGALTQPGGPLWNIGNSNRGNGLIEFPGGIPLYKDGVFVGAIGVSGDGVDEDEAVALAGSKGFEAPAVIRIDTVTGGKVPFTK